MKAAMPPASNVSSLMSREIDRFVSVAGQRSEHGIDTRRRALRRYHRSWPLLISSLGNDDEISAALHNVSPGGIGFLCSRGFPIGRVVLVKLFWHEDLGLRVPATVRHVTSRREAVLVGCEFVIDDESACQASFYANRWYE